MRPHAPCAACIPRAGQLRSRFLAVAAATQGPMWPGVGLKMCVKLSHFDCIKLLRVSWTVGHPLCCSIEPCLRHPPRPTSRRRWPPSPTGASTSSPSFASFGRRPGGDLHQCDCRLRTFRFLRFQGKKFCWPAIGMMISHEKH